MASSGAWVFARLDNFDKVFCQCYPTPVEQRRQLARRSATVTELRAAGILAWAPVALSEVVA
jgi:hypothetical protein